MVKHLPALVLQLPQPHGAWSWYSWAATEGQVAWVALSTRKSVKKAKCCTFSLSCRSFGFRFSFLCAADDEPQGVLTEITHTLCLSILYLQNVQNQFSVTQILPWLLEMPMMFSAFPWIRSSSSVDGCVPKRLWTWQSSTFLSLASLNTNCEIFLLLWLNDELMHFSTGNWIHEKKGLLFESTQNSFCDCSAGAWMLVCNSSGMPQWGNTIEGPFVQIICGGLRRNL